MRDPRDGHRVLPRDLAAGVWIGKSYEVAQYQLHEAVFPGRSAVVVSRFVKRWKERGLIAVERWNRIGMNRLRLTNKGRDTILLSGAAKPEDLFVPKRPVAPKDLAHRLWINDLRVVLGRLSRKPDLILPHWAIERRFIPRWGAIPDLLVVMSDGSTPRILAIEVDLGGESIRSVFAPKLKLLQGVLRENLEGNRSAILVLTSSERRRDSIAEALPSAESLVPATLKILPTAGGCRGLSELSKLFTPDVYSTLRSEKENSLCGSRFK